jgi:carbon monoxide dehydrogenase subunit G
MSDEVIIPASRETVWRALNDPQVLKQCIPGCESITKHSDTEMEAKVTIKLGPVKAGFKGAVTLSDLDPPNGYRISGEGKSMMGGAAGGANVQLTSVQEGTKLSYDVDANVTGKIASLAARFIDPTARMLAGQFFEKFAEIAASMEEKAPAPAPVMAAEMPEIAPAPLKEAVTPKVKKPAPKAPAKKPVVKKAAAKAPAKKAAPKKAAGKAPAKKAASKKATPKKAAAKPVAKKPAAKKPAKKATRKKR